MLMVDKDCVRKVDVEFESVEVDGEECELGGSIEEKSKWSNKV